MTDQFERNIDALNNRYWVAKGIIDKLRVMIATVNQNYPAMRGILTDVDAAFAAGVEAGIKEAIDRVQAVIDQANQ